MGVLPSLEFEFSGVMSVFGLNENVRQPAVAACYSGLAVRGRMHESHIRYECQKPYVRHSCDQS